MRFLLRSLAIICCAGIIALALPARPVMAMDEEAARELIKHYIKKILTYDVGSTRLKEISEASSPVDGYYRDLCIGGAKLQQSDFDSKTGLPTANDPDKLYGESTIGYVSGAKPKTGSCMPAIDTPKFTTPTSGDSSFSYFTNANDINHSSDGLNAAGTNAEFTSAYRHYRNLFSSAGFFVGGARGCPTDLTQKPPKSAEDWKNISGLCYAYYMLKRAEHPEWAIERVGTSTDDPLTEKHPERAIFDSCQPLMDGNESKKLSDDSSGKETTTGKGFARLFQYSNRPDLDDLDYDISKYLDKSWQAKFPKRTSDKPTFQNIFPCVETKNSSNDKVNWSAFNVFMTTTYGIIAVLECAFLDICLGPVYQTPVEDPINLGAVAEDYEYKTVGKAKDGYCPNVESILDPSNPFSPRDDFIKGNEKMMRDTSRKYLTDRGYSNETSFITFEERIAAGLGLGYNLTTGLIAPTPTTNAVTSTMSGLKGKISDLKSQAMSATSQLSSVTSQMTDMKNQMDKITSQLTNPNMSAADLKNNLVDLKSMVSGLKGSLGGLSGGAVGSITGMLSGSSGITGMSSGIAGQLTGISSSVSSLSGMVSGKSSSISGLASSATSMLSGGASSSSSSTASSAAAASSGSTSSSASGSSPSTSSTISGAVTSMASSVAGGGISSAASSLPSSIGTSSIGSIASQMTSALSGTGSQSLTGSISSLQTTIGGSIPQIQQVQDSITSSVSSAISEGMPQLTAMEGQLDGAIAELENASASITEIQNEVMNTMNEIQNTIMGPINEIQNQITDAMNSISDSIMDSLNSITEQMDEVISSSFEEAANSVTEAVGGAVSDAVGGAVSDAAGGAVSSAVGSVASTVAANMNRIPTSPAVQCAIVPVDILEPRRKAFDNCIMQRIEYNFFSWRLNNFLKMYDMDDSNWKPPCSTKYDKSDKVSDCPVKMSIQQCCQIIVKDVVPINHLKMRTCEGLRDRLGGKTTVGTEEQKCDKTEPEDYTFKHYFPPPSGEKIPHMPYMRWWDTGTSAGNSKRGGSFTNTLGAYDVIIGVGREERNKEDAKDTSGSGGVPKDKDVRKSQMGRIDGWSGLQGHQMWTTRRSNLACIGRYERLFKEQGGAENFVLSRAGAQYQDKSGHTYPWPLGWRGYINDPNNEFEKNITATGLDNAEDGDIVIFEKMNNLDNEPKQIGYISKVDKDSGFVQVESWDQGKFPTASGSGADAGRIVDRRIFKTSVPSADQKLIKNAKSAAKSGNNPSCGDPLYTSCVLPNNLWDTAKLYRPKKDSSRLCPDDPGGSSVRTSKTDTSIWAKCVNDGYDPPMRLRLPRGYNGISTGENQDLTICGAGWGECSSTSSKKKCFSTFTNKGEDCGKTGTGSGSETSSKTGSTGSGSEKSGGGSNNSAGSK